MSKVDFGFFEKAMMKTERFPVTVSVEGVSAKIRRFSRIKNGKTHTTFAAEYFLLGKRKQEWRSGFDEAETAALNACRQISRGQQVSLQLANGDRLEYLRANEALNPIGVKLDVAAHEYAGAMTLLGGRATIIEACRDWIKRNSVAAPKSAVAAAVALLTQLQSHGECFVEETKLALDAVYLGAALEIFWQDLEGQLLT